MAFVNDQRSICCILLLCTFAQLVLVAGQPTTHVLRQKQKSLLERVFMTESGEMLNEYEMQARNCQSLCGHCDCMGFYCVEECICECNARTNNTQNNKMDTECLGIMQQNAKDLQLPFELLIQGPNANRIVRTALHLQQESDKNNTDADDNINARHKRSTIVIYKPAAAMDLKRAKRATNDNNMDWFNELTNGLLRPAQQSNQQWPILSNKKNDNTRRPSKISKPTALYKFNTAHNNNNIKMKKQQKSKSDPKLFNESMEYEKYNGNKNLLNKSKQENRKHLVKTSFDKVDQDANTSTENLADLLYVKPMKVLDQMPAAVRDAIRRIRNEPINEDSLNTEQQKEDMPDNSLENLEDSEEVNVEEHNFAEILRDLHEQLLKSMESPRMKANKGKLIKGTSEFPHMNKSKFLQRLEEIISNS